jgi:hypothetical protein
MTEKENNNYTREKYHFWMEKFKTYIPIGSTLCDIGVAGTSQFNYKACFKDFRYRTLDKDASLNSNVILDLENLPKDCYEYYNFLLCNGVTEWCNNPFNLVEGCYNLLKKDGYALFGIILYGYPLLYSEDKTRFTVKGVYNLLKKFTIVEEEILYFNNLPSYHYLIVKKL